VVFRSGIIDKTTMYEAEFWHGMCYMGKVSTSYLQYYNHSKYCTIPTKKKLKPPRSGFVHLANIITN